MKWHTDSWLTCTVKCEKEQEQTSDQVPQECHYSTSEAFRDRIDRLNEEFKEYWHAAVDEDAHQDAGGIQDGCQWAKTQSDTLQFITGK